MFNSEDTLDMRTRTNVGGFRLFAHMISGGETFRVEAILRVCKSRNKFHNCFVMEESKNDILSHNVERKFDTRAKICRTGSG